MLGGPTLGPHPRPHPWLAGGVKVFHLGDLLLLLHACHKGAKNGIRLCNTVASRKANAVG